MVIVVIVAENILACVTEHGVIPYLISAVVIRSDVKDDIGNVIVIYFLP